MVALLAAHHGLFDGYQFMNVEEEPREMAHQKNKDETHTNSS